MRPPDAAKPASELSESGPRKTDRLLGAISLTKGRVVARYHEARRRLNVRIADLSTIAGWLDGLAARIARAQLLFEQDPFAVDFDALADEVIDFRLAKAMQKAASDG